MSPRSACTRKVRFVSRLLVNITAADCFLCWEKIFIHMQDQVRASAFRASRGFSLRQSVNAAQPCWGGERG